MNYNEKEFKSVSAGDLDIDTPEEKEEIKAKEEDAKRYVQIHGRKAQR